MKKEIKIFCRKAQKKSLSQGSFTVEAALLSGILFFLLLGFVRFGFSLYDRVVLYETAMLLEIDAAEPAEDMPKEERLQEAVSERMLITEPDEDTLNETVRRTAREAEKMEPADFVRLCRGIIWRE